MRVPLSPPPLQPLLGELAQAGHLLRFAGTAGPAPGGRYRHWDKLRHLEPPEGLTHRLWWALIKLSRLAMRREVPHRDRIGRPSSYTLPDPLLKALAQIDRQASGQIALPDAALSTEQRDRYIVNSLIEEAITSSQLEGASTTRRGAKEMIRSGRDPVSNDERMILANYQAMRWVRQHRSEALTPALVFSLHRTVASGTLDEEVAGVFRKPGEQLGVYSEGTRVHRPPDAEELPERLQALCAFANREETEVYMPPVVKAIILHYWLAYDHPFEDGNGRTARALFYWYLLKQGFWLFEYVSISTILKQGPRRYGRAFLYTETDENDLTYFILNQLDVILRALDSLQQYLERKMKEAGQIRSLLRSSADLNHRQIALLSHAHRHPGHEYTVASHQTSHRVAYQTARTDLLDLAHRDLLTQQKRGRRFVFSAPTNLAERVQQR
ncbi:MAG: Fic family protein [Bacteroidota bacterium]